MPKKILKGAVAGAAGTTERQAGAPLGRAAALGAATGLRGTVGLAALILRRNGGLPAAVRHPAARPAAAMAIASATALAAAKVGHDARAALARRLPDPVVAVAEDALAIGLAALGS